MLEIKNLNVSVQELKILRDINISVMDKEVVSIIGSNGAGKTTLLKAIAGLFKVQTGSISYNGLEINHLTPHARARLGIVYVPEGRRLFPYLTVTENLELGAYSSKARAKSKENLELVFSLFPRLQERRGQQAITLSGGEQQMLAIGRALMSSPELMLLDEPSLGLSPKLTNEIFSVIKKLYESGLTMILVEQNAKRALELSNRTYVLENGSVILQGASEELLCDDRIRKAYLGF